jgi:C4-dicarboxylate-specific signal transduction histidine kinase
VTTYPNTADVPLETTVPCALASLDSILRTEELRRRPRRPAEYEKETSALTALVRALADSPSTILQTLADKVLEILQSHSAGLSLLTKDEKRFYWAAVAGVWKPHLGGGTPRDFGPCGDVLDHNAPMLFSHFELRYPYFYTAIPPAVECLLVPFYVNGKAVGTVWAIVHDDSRQFDGEDLRLLESMGHFASAAYQAVESIKSLRLQISAREEAELHLRELADSLEAQVRARTEQLRLSEAFLAEAQRLSHTGSFSWRVETNDITWSKELYRIFEVDPALPLTLELLRSRIHPEDISSFYDLIDRASAGAQHYEYERRLKLPDRTVKYIHVIAHGTRDKDGRLEYIGAVQDVTERRLSEQALDKTRSELARMARVTSLGALTASIAHEVNQPLLGIVTNASTCLRMLAADPPNIEGAQETARFLVSDGHRASDVIKRLHAFFSKKSTTMELVDLSEATQEVVALSSGELRRNRVIVRTACAHELPPVYGDRVQLQQVILNLLLNASEAMRRVDDRPRQLLIGTNLDEDGNVRLTVQDAGVGFESKDIERLFESFYTTKTDGMGIGLSLSRSIIEGHRGHIWAEPNFSGPGATFSFAIPRAPEDATSSLGLGVLQPCTAAAAGAFAVNL